MSLSKSNFAKVLQSQFKITDLKKLYLTSNTKIIALANRNPETIVEIDKDYHIIKVYQI